LIHCVVEQPKGFIRSALIAQFQDSIFFGVESMLLNILWQSYELCCCYCWNSQKYSIVAKL